MRKINKKRREKCTDARFERLDQTGVWRDGRTDGSMDGEHKIKKDIYVSTQVGRIKIKKKCRK